MKRTRRRFTATFKTKVVLEALKERETIQELAVRFELHPKQISMWKHEFLENADKAFADDGAEADRKAAEKEKEDLHKQIGRLSMENEWLKKGAITPLFLRLGIAKLKPSYFRPTGRMREGRPSQGGCVLAVPFLYCPREHSCDIFASS